MSAVLPRWRGERRHKLAGEGTRRLDAGALLGALALLGSSVAVAAVVVALRKASPYAMNGLGLVGALPPAALLAFAVLAAQLGLVLAVPGVRQWVRITLVLALVVVLDLAPVLLEPLPHFATAWVHAGYADYIARTGHILPTTDARFSWPGFFAAAGLMSRAVGVPPLTLVRWAPLALDLLAVAPVLGLLRTFVADPRRRAFGLTVFVLGNWVGQTYFAPQGVNYLLYLVAVLVLLRFLSVAQGGRGARVVGGLLLRREGDESLLATAAEPSARWAALMVAVVLLGAVVVSHQLTPFFALVALAALVALGVTRLPWLLLLLAVMVLAYFVWGAQDFWSGHLRGLLDDVGAFGRTLRLTVVDRASGAADGRRQLVLQSRLVLPLLVGLIALVGLARSRSRALVVPAVLALVPVLVIGLQSYGGESALRVYLFMLPWLAILGAHAIGAEPARHGRFAAAAVVAMPLVLVAGLGLFGLARYGNEHFEWMRPVDHEAVSYAYRHAEPGAGLFAMSESVPWRDHDVERFHYGYATRPPLDRAELDAFLDTIAAEPVPSLLVLTDGQWNELHELAGLSDSQVAQVQELVRTSDRLQPLWLDGHVGVYEVKGATP